MSVRPALILTRRQWLSALLGAAALAMYRPTAAESRPATLQGQVLDIHDGDSLTLRSEEGRKWRIRIAGIDAPELSQPAGDTARALLVELIRNRSLRIAPVKTDAYERTVAKVWVLGLEGPEMDVGLALIEAGLAWHFVRYRADQPPEDVQRYAQAEKRARAQRFGIWQQARPEAPWDHRARMRREESGSTLRSKREPPS